jgi:hypothetical protein
LFTYSQHFVNLACVNQIYLTKKCLGVMALIQSLFEGDKGRTATVGSNGKVVRKLPSGYIGAQPASC